MSFVPIDEKFLFKGCHICDAHCCKAQNGYALTPLIIEDIPKAYEHFAILFGYLDHKLRLFMLLNDGKNSCVYLKGSYCTIYDKWPPACRIYPVTPFYDKLLIDTTCPSVSTTHGQTVYAHQRLQLFNHPRLDNFSTKYLATQEILDNLDANSVLKPVTNILGIKLYAYTQATTQTWLLHH